MIFNRPTSLLLRAQRVLAAVCFPVSGFRSPVLKLRYLLAFVLWQSATPGVHASRLKDLTLVEGGRDNQLVGYGLVVGLAGDGDSNATATSP